MRSHLGCGLISGGLIWGVLMYSLTQIEIRPHPPSQHLEILPHLFTAFIFSFFLIFSPPPFFLPLFLFSLPFSFFFSVPHF